MPSDSPGCVVLDLQMPELSGFDLQEALAKLDNPLPIVFLTGHDNCQDAARALQHGAEAFVSKRAPKEDLLGAIERALVRGAQERAQREQRRELRARFDTLTTLERQVLARIVRGQVNTQIAADLSLSEQTVKHHCAMLIAKIHVHSVAELMRLVQEADLLPTMFA